MERRFIAPDLTRFFDVQTRTPREFDCAMWLVRLRKAHVIILDAAPDGAKNLAGWRLRGLTRPEIDVSQWIAEHEKEAPPLPLVELADSRPVWGRWGSVLKK